MIRRKLLIGGGAVSVLDGGGAVRGAPGFAAKRGSMGFAYAADLNTPLPMFDAILNDQPASADMSGQ